LTGSNFTRSGHFREFVEGSGAAKMTIPGVHAEFVLPRLTFWMNALPSMVTVAVRSVFSPRIGRSLALDRP
jgi:hypothetical protein